MERYKNLDRNSSIFSYEFRAGYIDVAFEDGTVYRYTVASAGSENLNNMKVLATSGRGLNSYINTYVKRGYQSKRKMI